MGVFQGCGLCSLQSLGFVSSPLVLEFSLKKWVVEVPLFEVPPLKMRIYKCRCPKKSSLEVPVCKYYWLGEIFVCEYFGL